ncbi:hypothetical protein GF342_00670 [Candidatus Woesearchaeota archaeon]|nr:hypothetical protein [Candidatus Woesearchaeota archaeon]
MYNLVDMQTHSWYSDGTDSPEELMRHASHRGLAGVVITDHSVMDHWDESLFYAKRFQLISTTGIELYARASTQEVHLLGYGMKHTPELARICKEQCDQHNRRARQIIERYKKRGFDFCFEDIPHKGYLARFQIAQFVAKRIDTPVPVVDMHSRSDKYGGVGGFAAVPAEPIPHSTKEVIDAIHEGGGRVSLAHPGEYGNVEDLIVELDEQDIDGIECRSKKKDLDIVRKACNMAWGLGLPITGGSDYHGSRFRIQLGDAGVSRDDFFHFLH